MTHLLVPLPRWRTIHRWNHSMYDTRNYQDRAMEMTASVRMKKEKCPYIGGFFEDLGDVVAFEFDIDVYNDITRPDLNAVVSSLMATMSKYLDKTIPLLLRLNIVPFKPKTSVLPESTDDDIKTIVIDELKRYSNFSVLNEMTNKISSISSGTGKWLAKAIDSERSGIDDPTPEWPLCPFTISGKYSEYMDNTMYSVDMAVTAL